MFTRVSKFTLTNRAIIAALAYPYTFGQAIPGGGGRLADCSHFVGQILRWIGGMNEVRMPPSATRTTTQTLAADMASFAGNWMHNLTLAFLHDNQSVIYAARTIHVAIVYGEIPKAAFTGGPSNEVLRNMLVLDLFDRPAPNGWSVHRASDWFGSNPTLRIRPFAGAVAPAFGDDRYAITLVDADPFAWASYDHSRD